VAVREFLAFTYENDPSPLLDKAKSCKFNANLMNTEMASFPAGSGWTGGWSSPEGSGSQTVLCGYVLPAPAGWR